MPNTSYADQVNHLINKMGSDKTSLERSASYYEATYRVETVGISTPKEMQCLASAIGWPRMYVDSIEERLDLESFRLANREEAVKRLLQWWQSNNLDEESGLAHIDALTYGRSYVTVSAPGPGDPPDVPIIRVESPLVMWAETDPRTQEVTRAVRLYTDPDDPAQQWATLYLPNETVYLKYLSGNWVADRRFPKVRHNLGVVPVVPITNRERLADRYGRSEITPELRSFTDAASRVMMNMQAAAEMMALPQRVLFGLKGEELAPEGDPMGVLRAYMAQIIAVEDTDGKAQQFSAAELRNFVEVLQEIAKHVASYTGLPPQYLSFTSENPASAEAIKSSETRLVKKCEKKARMFGGSWERVMRLAMLIMDGSVPSEFLRLQSVWRDPSTPTYAAKADGASKLYNSGQGIIPKKRARIDMGYSDEEIGQMEDWDKDDKADLVRLADVLGASQQQQDPDSGATPNEGRRDAA